MATSTIAAAAANQQQHQQQYYSNYQPLSASAADQSSYYSSQPQSVAASYAAVAAAAAATNHNQQHYMTTNGSYPNHHQHQQQSSILTPVGGLHMGHQYAHHHHHHHQTSTPTGVTPNGTATTTLLKLESACTPNGGRSSPSTVSSLQYSLDQATKSTKGASKLRRDLINTEVAQLRELLPLPASTRQRLSQLQLMALVLVYVRKSNYFCNVFRNFGIAREPSLTSPTSGFSKALNGFIMMLTRKGKLLYISDNAAEYLGHSMEDLLSHGDEVYDIIEEQDKKIVRHELLSNEEEDSKSSPSSKSSVSSFSQLQSQQQQHQIATAPGNGETRIALCRMNVSRNARRQMRFGDQKVVLIEGHYSGLLPLSSRDEPVFLATCTPVAMPETRECVVQGSTQVFTSIHSMDMKFLYIDSIGEHHLDCSKQQIHGTSWYELIQPEYLAEAQAKHKRITTNEQERSTIALLRMMTLDHSAHIWVHSVMQVKEAADSTTQPVIVCTNQVLSEREAQVMRANSWLYQFYSLHSKMHCGAFAASSPGDELRESGADGAPATPDSDRCSDSDDTERCSGDDQVAAVRTKKSKAPKLEATAREDPEKTSGAKASKEFALHSPPPTGANPPPIKRTKTGGQQHKTGPAAGALNSSLGSCGTAYSSSATYQTAAAAAGSARQSNQKSAKQVSPRALGRGSPHSASSTISSSPISSLSSSYQPLSASAKGTAALSAYASQGATGGTAAGQYHSYANSLGGSSASSSSSSASSTSSQSSSGGPLSANQLQAGQAQAHVVPDLSPMAMAAAAAAAATSSGATSSLYAAAAANFDSTAAMDPLQHMHPSHVQTGIYHQPHAHQQHQQAAAAAASYANQVMAAQRSHHYNPYEQQPQQHAQQQHHSTHHPHQYAGQAQDAQLMQQHHSQMAPYAGQHHAQSSHHHHTNSSVAAAALYAPTSFSHHHHPHHHHHHHASHHQAHHAAAYHSAAAAAAASQHHHQQQATAAAAAAAAAAASDLQSSYHSAAGAAAAAAAAAHAHQGVSFHAYNKLAATVNASA